MPINNPYASGEARKPRCRVLCNGIAVPGVVNIEVVANSYYHGDTFNAEFALNASGGNTLEWWGSQNFGTQQSQTDAANNVQVPLVLDFQVQSDTGQTWTSLIVGETDAVQIHPDTGSIQVQGHDLTQRFIATKTFENFPNQTFSQIATTLAARHGLTADITPTSTIVGRYYTAQHDRATLNAFSHATTEWDLLTSLAQRENFDVWVDAVGRGTNISTLHAHPKADPNADPYVVVCQTGPGIEPYSNVINLQLERSMTLAKDVQVVVMSWHTRQSNGKGGVFPVKAFGISPGAKSPNSQSKNTGPSVQRYVFQFPNMTQEDAQAKANQLLAQISAHERVISWHAPGDTTLTTRNMLRLEGTNSSWDGPYFIDTITRRVSMQNGFTMDVRAKNVQTQSQAVLA